MWWLYALVGSFFLAMYVNYNQIAKLSSLLLMMYRGFGGEITGAWQPLSIALTFTFWLNQQLENRNDRK